MKTKLLLGTVFLGILVLAVGGFTVRRTRRAIRLVFRPVAPGSQSPAYA